MQGGPSPGRGAGGEDGTCEDGSGRRDGVSRRRRRIRGSRNMEIDGEDGEGSEYEDKHEDEDGRLLGEGESASNGDEHEDKNED